MQSPLPHLQRGAAALIVTMLLFLALALLALGINRHLLIEQRSAANHARAAQAFEAAEAGLDWAQARVNDIRRIGADCRASDDAAATTFRARYLRIDRVDGAVSPASTPATCVRDSAGWSCRCGPSDAGAPSVDPAAPSFTVTFAAAPRAGTVRVVSASVAARDGSAHAEATLGLYAGLRNAPPSAITTRDMTGADVDRFFATGFGTDKASWRDQPVVAHVVCNGECGREIGQALAAGHDLVWIDGDATLNGPIAFGSPAQPVVLVATGAVRLEGGVTLHGVVYAESVMLVGADNVVHGAVLSETGYAGPAGAGVDLDADVLATLTHQSGSFVRIPGSWHDF